MSRERKRLGLKKPRTVERKLREAAWQDKGALKPGMDRAAAQAAADERIVSSRMPVDFAIDPMEAVLLLEEFVRRHINENESWGDAWEALARLHYLIASMRPDFLETGYNPAVLLEGIVSEYRAKHGGSYEQAIEIAVQEFEIPGATFDGAIKTTKLKLGKNRR